MMEYEGFPEKWGDVVREGKDGYLRFDYSMTTPLLWSALQHALHEIDNLKKDINRLKKDNSDNEASPKAKAKAKSKAKAKAKK